MQETRRHILNILKKKGEATVEELVEQLRNGHGDELTAVTIRHHLKILAEEGLINASKMRSRTTPGRPQHVYRLTEQGMAFFPSNYQRLAANLLKQVEEKLPPSSVNVILEGVATTMAEEASVGQANMPMPERLDSVVEYLNRNGYQANWEAAAHGYHLMMSNCPYRLISHESDSLCRMDMRLIAAMLGVVPRLVSQLKSGDEECAYFIPASKTEPA